MKTVNHTFLETITGRSAQAISAKAGKFTDTILFTSDNRTVNAASLLGLLSLHIVAGDTVKITVKGINEESEDKTLSEFVGKL